MKRTTRTQRISHAAGLAIGVLLLVLVAAVVVGLLVWLTRVVWAAAL